ncbi:MAG: hypothetical protein V7754_06000 [Halioglobus sp.]
MIRHPKFLFPLLPPALLSLAACGGGGGSGGSSAADSSSQSAATPRAEVTYYSAAKPLLDRYCVSCHNDSGVAPFPLSEYQQVYSKRSALIYVLESATMPPIGYADLGPSESQLLLDWLDAGAPKGDESQTPTRPLADNLTYQGDTRRIIEEKCLGCHVEGDIAPFPLDDYDKVHAVGAAAAFSIRNGTMPPWPPTRGFTPLANERALSDSEKHVLLSWLEGDMAEGNPADYQPPELKEELTPPDFNLQVQLPEAYTPTLRPDDHRCFAIDWPLDEFAYVTAASVKPDQKDEVHHVIVSIVEPEDVHLYADASGEDGRPGWYCLGMGGLPGAPFTRQIGGWVPGAGREPAPEGTGIGVKPGSLMIVQMHYNTLVAQPTPDQSTILIATAESVERPARSFLITRPELLQPGGMPIPAGDPRVQHEATLPAYALALVFGQDLDINPADPWAIHQSLLHMHNLGTQARSTLIRADGTEQVLVDIRDWDFNWQGTYNFEREVLVQPTDLIKLECTWDNSQENQPFVDGEQLVSQYVEWGDGSGDEMCLMSLLMTKPKPDYDYSYQPGLHLESPAYRDRFAPGDLVPLKLVLNNFTLQDPAEHSHDNTQHDGTHSTATDDHSTVFRGHYHVYLDNPEDDAEHLTAWDDSYYFQLPGDIEPGLHTLRVNLRSEDHHALGIEQEVQIEVVNDTELERLDLVDVNGWSIQAAEDDSLVGHRPATVDCPDNSWYNEDDALEVETGYCNYLSLSQPSKVDIQTGETLHLVLWHGDLAFEAPASSHVAISIAGNIVWEADVEIPADAEIFDVRVPLDFSAPSGSTIEYHLHNHGYNSWTLLQLELER